MAQPAPLDALAHLACPPAPKANRGAAALHAGQLLAYAAGAAVVVVDAQSMSVATTLSVAHRQAAVTALAWHPGGGPREPRAAAQLRLASGDEEGRVMVWNASTGAVIAALEDPWASAFGTAPGARRPDPARPPVVGLAWATAAPSVLAVLLAPAILLLWDYRAGGIVWRKDFGSAEAFTGLQVDPLDRRRLVLCGAQGSFVVLSLTNPAADRVRVQQYQVDIGPGGSLAAAFAGTRDLLLLLLQREIIAFDLEYGQPAASTPLPPSRAPLEALLGGFGHAAVGKPACEAGVDVLYCAHRDGSLSVWQRHARLLTYSCLGSARLLPPATKFGSANALAALAAGLWRGLSAPPDSASAAQADLTTQASLASGGKRPPGMARRVSSGTAELRTSQDLGALGGGAAEGGWAGGDAEGGGHSLLLMGASTNGRVWQWQLPLLAGTLPGPKAKDLPPLPKPELLGLLHSLPQRVTSFCVGPAPVALPGAAGAVVPLAAATASGSLELAVVQQGGLLPLHLGLSASLAAHPGPVQGLRWLGATARLASYSCEKASGGWRNTLLVTDVRNRVSLPFRQSAVDPAPLAGVRASPSGRHLLLLFRGAPSEIWAVGAGAQPARLRQVDLQFTAVEWLGAPAEPEAGAGAGAGGPWAASPRAAERAAAGYAFEGLAEEPPEERLAFCLVDGRAGVLGVRGRRISDTRPRRPAWQALAAGDFRALALGSWGQSVLLGDADGTLVHWDTASGRCASLDTGHGRVHRILASAPPAEAWYPRLPGSQAVAARLAVLFASGLVAVYDLDLQGDLWATHVTASAWAARVGRVTDAQWLTLPGPIGGGTVLAASLEDGSLALFDTVHTIDVRPRRARMLRYQAMLHAAPPPGADPGQLWGLLAPPPTPAAPLLPRAWGLLLRLLLQRGLPEAVLRELGGLAASVQAGGGGGAGRGLQVEQALERLEAEVWSRLPAGCQAAWEALLARRAEGEAGEPLSAAELRQLLDSCAEADEDEEGRAAAAGPDSAAAARGGSSGDLARQAGSPSWEGSAVRDEAAAAALGLTARQASGSAGGGGGGGRRRGDVAATFKSLGGAFRALGKDVASAGRSQLKSLAGGGRGQTPLVAAVAGVSDGYEYAGPSGGGAGPQSLVGALHAIATARGQPAVLSPAELDRYSAALASHRVADRMALAAELLGDGEEARFWRRLPATLAWLGAALAPPAARLPRGGAAGVTGRTSIEGRPPLGGAGGSGTLPAAAAAAAAAAAVAASGAAGGRRLWDEQLELAEALERSAWHEQMSRRVFEGSEDLQEKRVLEYCALGDFQTAVGFLLASPPDRSQRYYRDALCTLGMAFAAGLQQAAITGGGGGAGQGAAGGGAGFVRAGSGSAMAGQPASAPAMVAAAAAAEDTAARTLFVQAAKVIAANAASVGDTLLGVPLLCSAGQHADAAGVLQDAGLWRYASALVAHALRDGERAAAMERWAGHVAAAEGRPWAAAGLLVAAGALKSALALLRQHGLPDAAAALVAACRDADLLQPPARGAGAGQQAGTGGGAAPGELQNLFSSGAAGGRAIRYSSGERPPEGSGDGSGAPGDGQAAPAAPLPQQLQRTATLSDWERGETARDLQLYVAELLQQL